VQERNWKIRQEKYKTEQAEDVNRARVGKGGEVIRKWMVSTLALPIDKKDFTPKNLPALLCGHNYYKKSNIFWYRLCMENGILKGTYGREQLIPCPDVSQESLVIKCNTLDKNNCITQTEAGEMYSKLGKKLSFCRCGKDCSKSMTCKCKKLKKLLGLVDFLLDYKDDSLVLMELIKSLKLFFLFYLVQ
jgi:hypothetical protein